jgi:hypothetical protein
MYKMRGIQKKIVVIYNKGVVMLGFSGTKCKRHRQFASLEKENIASSKPPISRTPTFTLSVCGPHCVCY